MKDLGIKPVEEKERRGKPSHLFTLWFTANVAFAPFALGFIPALLHMSFLSAIISLSLGTFIGSIFIAINSVMGAETGKAQMVISEGTYMRGNVYVSFMQWFTTLGWASVNLILGLMALVMLTGINYLLLVPVYVAVQIAVVFMGHDFIHKFSKALAMLIVVIFLYISVDGLISGAFETSLPYKPTESLYVWGTVFSLAFGYVVSWAPAGADYSRYLPTNSSKSKIFLYTLLGNFLSSIWMEILGFVVLLSTNIQYSPVEATYKISGYIGVIALIAFALGIIGRNAVNFYSNTLALNTIFKKADRNVLLIISATIATILSVVFYTNFYRFYENLLDIFNYWIMPWLGVLFADYFFVKRGNTLRAISAYIIGALAMLPFIDISGFYSGFLAKIIGFDVSYFVAFLVSFLAYLTLRRKM